MDHQKKKAIISWVNCLLPDQPITSLFDLVDGRRFVSLIKLCERGESDIVEIPTTICECYIKIRYYLEEHYLTELDPQNSVLNFDLILKADEPSCSLEWELAKVLYALLGAFVQDKKKELFVSAALSLPQEEQLEIMQLLEPIVISHDLTTRLPQDFADVLKTKRESAFQSDAALFFKIVTEGNNMVTSTPTVDQSFNFPNVGKGTPLTPIPQHVGNESTGLVHEISSPLRMLTLASPVTPLGALMQSPQLVQKVLLRQKEKELKKLELVVASERHLRENVELDLRDKSKQLSDKDKIITDLEGLLKEQRKIKDAQDEVEQLKAKHDLLEQKYSNVQLQRNELLDLKEHCQFLETTIKENEVEIETLKTQLQAFETLKKSHQEYRNECHNQKLKISELESVLDHRNLAAQQALAKVQELEESRSMIKHQLDITKEEKAQLEEMMVVGGMGCHNVGESMAVVTEKRIRELEEELENVKKTWVDPEEHKCLEKKFADISDTEKLFETKFMETHQHLLEKDGELEQVQQLLSAKTNAVELLETCRSELLTKLTNQQTEIDILRTRETELSSALQATSIEKQEVEETNGNLQKELSRTQAEMQLLNMESESQKQAMAAIENRRQTMAASVDLAVSEKNTLQQMLSKERSSWEDKIDKLKAQLRQQKEEATLAEDSLKTKLKTSQSSLKQLEIRMENEVWVKDNSIKCLKQEMSSLKEEINETEARLNKEVDVLKEVKVSLEAQLAQEKGIHQRDVEEITCEIEKVKQRSRSEEERLQDLVSDWQNKCEGLKVDLERVRIECENQVKGLKTVTEKQEVKLSESQKSLLQCESDMLALKENLAKESEVRTQVESSLKCLQKELENEKNSNAKLVKKIEHKDQVISSNLEANVSLEKKLQGRETEISNIQMENLNKLQSMSEELDSFQKAASGKEENLTKELAKSRQDSDCLQKQLDQLKEQYRVYVDKSSTMDSRLADLTRQIEMRNGENQELTQHVARLQEETEELNGQVALVTKVAEKKQVENDRVTEENCSLLDRIHHIKIQNDKISEENSELKQNLKSVTAEKENIEQICLETQTKVQELETHVGELTALNASVKEKLENTETTKAEFEVEVNSLQDRLKQEEHQLHEKSAEIDLLMQSLSEKSQVISDLENSNSKLHNTVQELTQNDSETSTSLKRKDEEISSLNHHVSDRENVISDLSQKLCEASETLKQRDEEMTSLKDRISDRESAVSNLSKKLGEANESIKQRDEEIVSMNDRISDRESAVSDLSQKLGEASESIKQRDEEIASMNDRISDHESAVSDLSKKLGEASELLKQRDEEITSWKDRISDHENTISDLSQKFDEASALLRQKDEEITSLKNQISDHENMVSDLSQKLCEADVSLKQKDEEFLALSENGKGLDLHVKRLTEQKESLQKLCNETSEEVVSLKHQVSELKQVNIEQTETIEHLEAKCELMKCSSNEVVCELEKKVITVGKQCEDKLKSEREHHEKQMDILKQDMAKAHSSLIQSHEEKMRETVESLTATNQELKHAGEKRRAMEQSVLELKQKLSIETDSKENLKRVLESKVFQVESELKHKTQLLEEMQSSQRQNMEEIENYWKSQLHQLEAEYHKATEDQQQEYKNQLASQEQSFQSRLQALMQEKEMMLVSQKAAFQNNMSHQEKKLAQKQQDLENQRKKLIQEHSEALEQVKLDYQQKMDTIQNLLNSEAQSQKLLANQLQDQKSRCDELEHALREGKQSFESSMTDKTKHHREEIEKLKEEHKSILATMSVEHSAALEEKKSQRKTMERKCEDLRQELSDVSMELTSSKQKVKHLEGDLDLYRQKHQMNVVEMKELMAKQESEFHIEVSTLETQCTTLENQCSEANSKISQLEKKVKDSDGERARLQQINDSYKIHYNKKKEMIDLLTKEVEVHRKIGKEYKTKSSDLEQDVQALKAQLQTEQKCRGEMQDKNEKLKLELTPLQTRLHQEAMKNKTLSKETDTKVAQLETQLNLANEKIKGYQQQLEITSAKFIGDNTHFMQHVFQDETMEEKTLRKLSTSPTSSEDVFSVLSSTSDLGTSINSRRSMRSRPGNMDQSVISTESGRSISSLPRGTGNLFSSEDEPADMADMEWKRFNELQRRNTLLQPHLRTAYPVETQQYSEKSVRESIGCFPVTNADSMRKRKQTSSSDEGETSEKSKQAKHGTVYQKPGPPTPGNSNNARRNSKGTPRYNLRSSPRTPIGNSRSKRTPKRSTNEENMIPFTNKSAKKLASSIAFSIGNTPKNRKLSRQTGFVTPSSSKGHRKPLKNKNYLQTGV